MFGYVSAGRPPLAEPLAVILGHDLSPMASQFATEYADFLTRVDFKDIAKHSVPDLRSAEAHSSSDGQRHTVWLDTKNENFEALMMHNALRGILTEKGFPKVIYSATVDFDIRLYYLASLLASAVTDPIIDRWLIKGGYAIYDRETLVRRSMEQVWLDTRLKNPKTYGFRFCKWSLLTVLMKLDLTFEGENVNLLYALIRKKFPEPWEIAERLSRFILKKGFTEPYSALIAMLQLRSALKLDRKVAIIDGEGTHY